MGVFEAVDVPDDIDLRLVSGDEKGGTFCAVMVVVNDWPSFCSVQGAMGTMLGSPWTSGP